MTASTGLRISLNLIVLQCYLIKQCDSLLCMVSRAKRSSCLGFSELLAVTHTFHTGSFLAREHDFPSAENTLPLLTTGKLSLIPD